MELVLRAADDGGLSVRRSTEQFRLEPCKGVKRGLGRNVLVGDCEFSGPPTVANAVHRGSDDLLVQFDSRDSAQVAASEKSSDAVDVTVEGSLGEEIAKCNEVSPFEGAFELRKDAIRGFSGRHQTADSLESLRSLKAHYFVEAESTVPAGCFYALEVASVGPALDCGL